MPPKDAPEKRVVWLLLAGAALGLALATFGLIETGGGGSGMGFEELKYLSDRAAGEAALSSEQSAGGWPELAPRVIR